MTMRSHSGLSNGVRSRQSASPINLPGNSEILGESCSRSVFRVSELCCLFAKWLTHRAEER